MQIVDGNLRLSTSDLIGHLNCQHLTELELAAANGHIGKPQFWDPLLDILRERGIRHEKEYVEHLRATGLAVVEIEGVGVDDGAVARTREAMQTGAQIIVQGAFRSVAWAGRTDILRRIGVPSQLGPWSYEIIDTKLARETKGGTVLQLCLYAELVASVQGMRPDVCYVVAPWTDFEPQAYRMDDYGAYFRRVRDGMVGSLRPADIDKICPEPREHCEVCRWQERCDARRRKDDHLSFVAGVSKLQIEELKRQGVVTATALASMPMPLSWKPTRGAAASYERVREQARIQVEGREAGKLLHEFLPVAHGFGLACLPPPSAGDVFFDMEGDPFVGDGDLEYLFGYVSESPDDNASYTADWVFTHYDEKQAFERFVDFVMDRLGRVLI
jgi:predicted RecB family nuclease